MAAPAKAAVKCTKCGGPINGQNYAIVMSDGGLICWGCIEKIMAAEVNRKFISEQNQLLKKVCPACRRRILREEG